MPNYLESPCIRRVIQLEPAMGVSLINQFVGRVDIIPKGSTLYHFSRSPAGLVKSQHFIPKKASNPYGAFYLTDLPIPDWTNCQVSVQEGLVLFGYDYLADEDIRIIEDLGRGDLWLGAMHLGFEGRTYRNPDPLTIVRERQYATEIVLFPNGFSKLGIFSEYR